MPTILRGTIPRLNEAVCRSSECCRIGNPVSGPPTSSAKLPDNKGRPFGQHVGLEARRLIRRFLTAGSGIGDINFSIRKSSRKGGRESGGIRRFLAAGPVSLSRR
jgi:hypothetical protein